VVSERNVRAALAALVLLAAGCDWSLREVLSHPTVEQRVRESLAMPPVEPPPVNPDSFRFAMFGDPQVRKDGIHRLGRFREHVVERGIDFVCVLGDLTHDATEEQIQWMRSALDSLGVPVYAAPGNHDLYQTGAWDRFKEVFGPGCQWFRAGRVRIILFDTAGGIIGPTQFRWLEEQLSLSADEIKVLGTHFPLFDGGMPDLYRWRARPSATGWRASCATPGPGVLFPATCITSGPSNRTGCASSPAVRWRRNSTAANPATCCSTTPPAS